MDTLTEVRSRQPEPSGADGDTGTALEDQLVATPPARLWWCLGFCVAAVIASALQLWSGQTERGYFLLVLCFLVCGVGAWIDVASRRIPNLLTYPAILVGLAINVLLPPLLEIIGAEVAVVWSGATGFTDGMLGFGLCAAIGIISFMARGLGGGDVKLLAAVGAMLGFHAVVAVLFNTLLVAAVIGLVNWALHGTLLARMQVVAGNLLIAAVTRGGLAKVYPFRRTESPFGLALLIGLTLAQFVALHRVLLAVSW
ncbi:MAG: A24 family peptidase [Planctomycetota bacterium]